MTRKKRTFQKPHPVHMKMLRELVGKHGRRATEKALGMHSGGLVNAIAGKGVYPTTIARISAYFAPKTRQLNLPLEQDEPIRRNNGKILSSGGSIDSNITIKELNTAANLVLGALSTVGSTHRALVLDMVRAAL